MEPAEVSPREYTRHVIDYTCPHCNTQLSAPEQFAGAAGHCRACGKPITIPEQSGHVATPGQAVAAPARPGPPPSMPKWRIVATIIVIIALLALFALMFFQWVLPAADTSGTAFTMGLPLLILGMIVLIVIIALIARRRMPTGRFVWLEDGAPPDTGGPWQYWGEKQMLACPHCGEKLDAAALAGDVQNVIAQIGANTTPVRRHTCPQCQARWESRLSDRPVDYRARVPKVHYDWRPVSGYAATGPPQHARKTTEAAQQQPDQRTEARRILQHYLREAQQQGAGTREEQVRRAEQQTLRVLMNRHSLAPDEAARLLEQAKRILQGQSPPPA